MLKFLHLSFYGQKQEKFEGINDISVHEFTVLASILIGLILFGIYPEAILGVMK